MLIKKILRWVWISSGALLPVKYKPIPDTYLFLPINGAGLGHVTRALAVAKQLRMQKPEARIFFMTTSIAVHLIYREGFVCHHVPPAMLINEAPVSWNILFYRSVVNVIKAHRVSTLVFDGSTPYVGLQRVMQRFNKLRYVWIKRGLYKSTVDLKKLERQLDLFDKVILPAELGFSAEGVVSSDNIHVVDPIVVTSRHELLSASDVISRLRLKDFKKTVYVQLGAGNINGIQDLQLFVVNVLKGLGYQVVVGQSPISLTPQSCDVADVEIVDYPNSRYFSGFDFAVLAAGYNSVYEAVSLRLPAIFIPNQATQADDQVQRAMLATLMGPCECVSDFSEQALSEAIIRLCKRIKSGEVFSDTESNGAVEAAKLVVR